ncbi:two-component system sensor histidine kinase RegB [Oxalobacteraceae bacterium GrIS 2.11]
MESLFTTAKKQWELVENLYSIVGRKNASHLIQLRWIAVIGQLSTIAIVNLVYKITIPTPVMLGIVIFLIAFNIASQLRWHETEKIANSELFLALLVDVATLTFQLYLSGGTQNPFAFLYLLQVSISAVLLETWATWFIIAITSACLAGLSVFSVPLEFPHDQNGVVNLYAQGMIICFVLNAALLTIFITRINGNLREGETQLADLRQRTVEEDHIVRMGLLASGAAHELGTPLATLSVILGDWQHMTQFSSDREIKLEMDEMQMQLNRCKSIISGILLSAGEVRSESSTKTTLDTFLNELSTEWRSTHAIKTFVFENHIVQDMSIAHDAALKQMLFNVLDNAFEASPDWVRLEASCVADQLELTVTDNGPGFNSLMLSQFGKPYQSSKERPGRGLGLFFVVNVARKLGGTVKPENRHHENQSGAIVQMKLPLSAIQLSSEDPSHVS